jgi:chromosome segregation ATPase
VDGDHQAASALRRERDEMRSALEVDRVAFMERDQQLEQARSDLLTEQEASAALRAELDEAQRALERETQKERPGGAQKELQAALQTERANLVGLEARLAQQREARMQLSEKLTALQRELESAQQAAHDMQAAGDSRVQAIESEKTAIASEKERVEQALRDAEGRADQAIRERDAIAADLDAARQAVAGAQAGPTRDSNRSTVSASRANRPEQARRRESRAEEAIPRARCAGRGPGGGAGAVVAMQAAVEDRLQTIEAGARKARDRSARRTRAPKKPRASATRSRRNWSRRDRR